MRGEEGSGGREKPGTEGETEGRNEDKRDPELPGRRWQVGWEEWGRPPPGHPPAASRGLTVVPAQRSEGRRDSRGWRRSTGVLRTTEYMDLLRLVVVWSRARGGGGDDSGCEPGGRRGLTASRGCPRSPCAGLLPALPAHSSGAAQQSPSVAMATSISLLPISSKALARLLRSPSSCCRASQRSRITPVGLALVAK